MAWTEEDDDRIRAHCKTVDVGALTKCPKCNMGDGGASEMMLARFCNHKYCPVREWSDAKDPYKVALAAWADAGRPVPRPRNRPDGVPTRCDMQWMTAAERAIVDAMRVVEAAGGSIALTDAVTLLSKARDRVADHIEGVV